MEYFCNYTCTDYTNTYVSSCTREDIIINYEFIEIC